MSVLDDLAFCVQHAAQDEGYEALARRCGIVGGNGRGIKNYIHRAAHPGEAHSETREYSPVLSENLVKLLDGLGLTVAPRDETVPTVAHVCMMVSRMDCHRVAKSMAIDAVHRAGLIPEETP